MEDSNNLDPTGLYWVGRRPMHRPSPLYLPFTLPCHRMSLIILWCLRSTGWKEKPCKKQVKDLDNNRQSSQICHQRNGTSRRSKAHFEEQYLVQMQNNNANEEDSRTMLLSGFIHKPSSNQWLFLIFQID